MFQHSFRSGLLLVAFLVSTSALQGQSRDSLIQSVSSLPEWRVSGSPVTFDTATAPKLEPEFETVRNAYGFSGVTVQGWQSPAGKARAALFQFTDAGSAYSFFTIRRRHEGTPSSDFSAGTESFQTSKFRYFWQSTYVVRLNGSEPATNLLAGILTERILGRSQRPSLSSHLPSRNVIAGSEVYLLDSANFSQLEGMDASSLGFDLSAEAAAADYRIEGKTGRLLLMVYPTQQIAKKFADQINSTSPELASTRKRIGPLLAIVSGISDSRLNESLLEQVHYQSTVTWSEPQPGLGLGPIVVTAFTFIGLLLGLCIVAGVGLGGARKIAKTFYPKRDFGRDRDTEIIQLKLDQ